ncbi:hypothetical protein GCM10018793_19200 [Streptomyces sulfonofaciens]|uniref:Uncharacterized protein n=1 Tax=Streptomyces sulfonofaciens TaxID=68272 RepID=A0A919FZU1_9ACTN|nr:hypothetical protein GCM10018793_19200 [Streptomyces sulfonofaciens]
MPPVPRPHAPGSRPRAPWLRPHAASYGVYMDSSDTTPPQRADTAGRAGAGGGQPRTYGGHR